MDFCLRLLSSFFHSVRSSSQSVEGTRKRAEKKIETSPTCTTQKNLSNNMSAASLSSSFFAASPLVGRGSRNARKSCSKSKPFSFQIVANADMMKEVGTAVLQKDSLKAERYVASNRFKLQKGKGPQFEKRWAERKSRLSKLDGFRFFTLMRRVSEGRGEEEESDYVSLTIWSNKENFDAWRTGEAFKEAHGGGTIFGFAEMLISSLMVLKGGPKPAFYDGLIPISTSPDALINEWQQADGWRSVIADGKNPLKSDVYVAMNRFKVFPGSEVAFEQRWKERESDLENCEGFQTFVLLRRDALQADDGYNYSTLTVWKDEASFQKWREGSSKKAHAKADQAKPLFEMPPSPIFYEGVLALVDPQGA
jgi:heme-degrading monooxygenase HmoA